MGAPRPPMDYLAKCSQMSLESMELARLNRAANLRKEFLQVLDELIESEVDARLARAILEWRRAQDARPELPGLVAMVTTPIETPCLNELPGPVEFEQLAIAFLPDSAAGCDDHSREGPPETQRGNRPRGASPSSNAAASENTSDRGPISNGRRTASARTSRALASPNTQQLRTLRRGRLTNSGDVMLRTSSAANRLSLEKLDRRRSCGNTLPRQVFANLAVEFVGCAGASRDAS